MEPLGPYLQQLGSENINEKVQALESLVEIMPRREENIDAAIEGGILTHLLPMVHNAPDVTPNEMKILELVTKAMRICSRSRSHVATMLINEPGLVEKLISLLQHPYVEVRRNALNVMANIAFSTENDEDYKRVLNLGILEKLGPFLLQNVYEAVWMIYNLTRKLKEGVDALFKADGLLELLVGCNLGADDDHVKRNVVGIIENITRLGSINDISKLKGAGVLKILETLLKKDYKADEIAEKIERSIEKLRDI